MAKFYAFWNITCAVKAQAAGNFISFVLTNITHLNFSKIGLQGLPANYNHVEQAEEIEGAALDEEFYGDQPRTKMPQQIALENVEKLNDCQLSAFNEIKKAIEECKGSGFFIEGAGGCGNKH